MVCIAKFYKYKILTLSILILLSATANLYGESTMEPLYTFNTALMPKLEPTIYSTGETEIQGLFDFPADNAIATNELPGTNAVTRIDFDEEKAKVKFKTVAKDFKTYVGGGDTSYLPIFSEDTIGYAQTRGFTLLDINTGKANYYSIIVGFEYYIVGVRVVNAEKRIFLFGIAMLKSEKPRILLRIMDLSDEKGRLISEKEVHSQTLVYSLNGTLFLLKGNDIQAVDNNFNEIDHPFVKLFNQEKDRFEDVVNLIIHPELPFAVFNDREKQEVWMASWQDDEPVMKKLLSNCESSHFRFSYDGNWITFQNFLPKPGYFILMPVVPELPHFVGKPILMGEIPEFPSGRGTEAMTRNPPGLVRTGTDDLGDSCYLKKWDFTKAEKFIEQE
ncbi:MAG: hypothetical protein ACLFNW_04485 [Desulfobacterales bacterium]